jgi:hypothetical protein
VKGRVGRRLAATGLVSGRDLAVVRGQLGRDPRPMSAVPARCPHGFPAVAECLPADEGGRPFPTLFYCTCPTLVATIAALESAGGVRVWTRRVAGSAALGASLGAAADEQRRRRADLVRVHGLTPLDGAASLDGGVGGVADPLSVKCLHAHVAHALARPGYEFGEAILGELERPWCDDRRCAVWASPEGA